jgi:hypothetical protein
MGMRHVAVEGVRTSARGNLPSERRFEGRLAHVARHDEEGPAITPYRESGYKDVGAAVRWSEGAFPSRWGAVWPCRSTTPL